MRWPIASNQSNVYLLIIKHAYECDLFVVHASYAAQHRLSRIIQETVIRRMASPNNWLSELKYYQPQGERFVVGDSRSASVYTLLKNHLQFTDGVMMLMMMMMMSIWGRQHAARLLLTSETPIVRSASTAHSKFPRVHHGCLRSKSLPARWSLQVRSRSYGTLCCWRCGKLMINWTQPCSLIGP